MSNQFTIDVASIRLRRFSQHDYDGLYELTRQTEITDLLPDWRMTEEQLKEFLSFIITSYEKFDPEDVRVLLAVEHKAEERLIGWCGVFPNDMLDPSAREVAYAISKDYRNQGYTTSAVRALVLYLLENTELDQIVAITKLCNPASRRVLEKAGFRHIHQVKLADQENYDYFEIRSGGCGTMARASMLDIRRAAVGDAEVLMEIAVRAFDAEMAKWLQEGEAPDRNLRPPGYNSIEMHSYTIREMFSYVIVFEGRAIGGASINYAGRRHARLDKIFIDPIYQGRGIGSKVMSLLENEFPFVEVWKLETSGRQVSNHHFYEKAGFTRTYESESEFGYEKRRKAVSSATPDTIETKHIEMVQSRIVNQNLSQAEFEECSMQEIDYYGIDMENCRYSNSSLQGSQFNDCNMSEAKFTNINLTHALLADLRLSNSEIGLVSLDGVHFHDTNLGEERNPILFERCDLSGSHIRSCNLANVNIQLCEMSGMRINDIPIEELLTAYYRTAAKQ